MILKVEMIGDGEAIDNVAAAIRMALKTSHKITKESFEKVEAVAQLEIAAEKKDSMVKVTFEDIRPHLTGASVRPSGRKFSL